MAQNFLTFDELVPDPGDLYFGFALHMRGRAPAVDWLREQIAVQVPHLPALTHRPRGQEVWEPDPDFDLAHHVRELAGPEPAAHPVRTLLDGCPPDPDRPRWRLLLLPGTGEDGWTLAYITHHAVQDAIGAVHTLRVLLGGTASPAPPARARRRSPAGVLPLLPDVLRAFSTNGAPPETSVRRRVLASRSVGLKCLTETARSAGVTVNQVHLAAMGAAIGRTGQWALVPVQTRRPEHTETGFENRFGLMRVPLPTALPRSAKELRSATAAAGRRRVDRHHHALRRLLEDSAGPIADWMLRQLPAPGRSALTVSNVRVDHPMSVFGTPVDRVETIPFMPPGHDCFSLLATYGDQASLSVLSSGRTDPEEVCRRWAEGVAELHGALVER